MLSRGMDFQAAQHVALASWKLDLINPRWDSTLVGGSVARPESVESQVGCNTLGSSVAGIQHSKVFRRWDATLSGHLGSSVAGIQQSWVFRRRNSTLSGLPSLGFNCFGSSIAGIQHFWVFRRWDSTASIAGAEHSRVYINTFLVMVLGRKAEKKRVMRVSRLMMLSWRRAEASSASRLTTRRPDKKPLCHLLYLKPDPLPSKPNE